MSLLGWLLDVLDALRMVCQKVEQVHDSASSSDCSMQANLAGTFLATTFSFFRCVGRSTLCLR